MKIYGYTDENIDALAAFREGRSALLDFEDGLDVVRLTMAAYMSAEQRRVIDVTDAERAEARAILDRVSDLAEPPDKRAARRDILLDLANAASVLQDVIARKQPLVRNGQVVTDPNTGQPIRDPAIERRARDALAGIERLRSELTGLPLPANDPAAEDGPQP